MKDMLLNGLSISPMIYIPIIYFLWVTVLLFFKKISYIKIREFAKKTRSGLDDVLFDSLDFPLVLLIFVSGIVFVEKLSPLSFEKELTASFVLAFKATAIIAVVLFFDRFLRNIIKLYSQKVELLKSSGGVAQTFVRIIVLILGLLILLDSFGVSITPIIASLGIGSLAVALALQPTLENFFSGIQIVIDKPIQVGQFVKLESGEEGYVDRIGWRSTWVRMLPNNMVILPNKAVVNSKVINYYYPQKEMAVLVQVGVHYDSDLSHVEQVTIEVAKETLEKVTGGISEFAPFIRYHTFNDFSIDFTVILRCKEFVDNYLIKHEFVKRLHQRYRKEGINIPYPIRAINYSQEKAGPAKT